MKVLKWIMIVLLAIAALVLIVPAFLPAETTISAEAEIAVTPEEICHYAALFTDRDKWDPWLEIEPDADVKISPVEGYIGSTYTWDGDKIGSGLMKVEKVVFGKVIQSSIWFGEEADSSVVEWRFKPTDTGTQVTWNFMAQGKYPFGRWMLMLMSGGMKSSFEAGLENLKGIIEANPPKMYKTGDIKVDVLPQMHVLVMAAAGTMEEITSQFERIFSTLFSHAGTNNLQVVGPPFAYYIDYDEESGFSNAMIGIQIGEKGKSTGEIMAKTFNETKAVITVHSGKYENLIDTYATLSKYVEENEIEVSGAALEVYLKTMMESTNPFDWKTKVAYPLKYFYE